MLTISLLLHRSIFITDIFRPKIKMYNASWRHALFVRGQSFSVTTFDGSRNGCQVIGEGAGNDFRGPSVQELPLPSRVSFSRAHFFLCPLLRSKRLLRRLLLSWPWLSNKFYQTRSLHIIAVWKSRNSIVVVVINSSSVLVLEQNLSSQ